MKIVEIPITKNLSADVDDLVGKLCIPESMADDMAGCFSKELGFRLGACIERVDGKYVLRHVSIMADGVVPHLDLGNTKGGVSRA